jgi:hypothetical protein
MTRCFLSSHQFAVLNYYQTNAKMPNTMGIYIYKLGEEQKKRKKKYVVVVVGKITPYSVVAFL